MEAYPLQWFEYVGGAIVLIVGLSNAAKQFYLKKKRQGNDQKTDYPAPATEASRRPEPTSR